MIIKKLHLCTWNVKEINIQVKRRKVLTFLGREHIDIAMLQETHLNDVEHSKLEQGGSNRCVFLHLLQIVEE